MGAEIPAPLVSPEVEKYNFTNEGGVAGTIRFLKNIMGMWLVQECRRVWERADKVYSYEELVLAWPRPPRPLSAWSIRTTPPSGCLRVCLRPWPTFAGVPINRRQSSRARWSAVPWKAWP